MPIPPVNYLNYSISEHQGNNTDKKQQFIYFQLHCIYYNITAKTLQVNSTNFVKKLVQYILGGDVMDINEKIRKLLKQRGWSEYRLAKNSGLSESTITNIFKRNTVPSITTLEAICNGLGITLSQFFAQGDVIDLTPELSEFLESWVSLTKEQKAAVIQLVKTMNK